MPTAGELHPTDGVRLVLELAENDAERAVYRAAIYTPNQAFKYVAQLRWDGDAVLELESDGDDAAAELVKKLENLAKSIARAAKRKVDDGLNPWPPKIMRWRK